MAVDSSCEGEPKIREFLDGNGSLPVSCSCLKLLKPSSDEVKQQVPLEVPSIVFEEASLPGELYQPFHSSLATASTICLVNVKMGIMKESESKLALYQGYGHRRSSILSAFMLLKKNSSEALPFLQDQDLNSISVLPDEVDQADCASPLAFFSILEVPDQTESLMSLDAQINCHSCIDFQMKSEEVCSSCTVDIPTVNGNSISPESYEEGVESFKTRNFLTRVLWRQASLKVGGKLMQILTNLTTSRVTSVTDKVHDLPSIRWRRYKRSASFDSRKVALLFSILSSVGSLVLIYLTLKVRQRGDGFVLI